MTDTQWPRYEVFKQDRLGKPHEAVGSVHAPDAEMALLNARNVFVRRPSAVSLWVVPAEAIFTLTREEMAANPDWQQGDNEGEKRPFLIFTKTSQRRAMTFVKYTATVKATRPQQAIATAGIDADVWVWWVFPQSAITRSNAADVASYFAPAAGKTYRQQTHYGFVSPTRKKRGKRNP